MVKVLCVWVIFVQMVFGQEDEAIPKMIKFTFVYEAGQDELLRHFQETLAKNYRNKYDAVAVALDDFEEDDNNKVCSTLSDGGTFIIDVSWSGNERIRPIAEKIGVPYIRIDASISPVLQLLDMYMDARNTTDVAFIFDNPKDVDEALYYWIEYSRLRMVVTDQLDTIAADRLRQMRPIPNSYAIVATAESMARIFQKCMTENLVQKPERWNLVFLDFKKDNFDTSILSKAVNLLYLPMEICCTLNGINECKCEGDRSIPHLFLSAILYELNVVLDVLTPQYSKLYDKAKCDETPFDNATKQAFETRFLEQLRLRQLVRDNTNTLKLRIKGNIEVADVKGKTQLLAKYSDDYGMDVQPNMMIKPVKPFYRIGTTEAIPWSYKQLGPTGEMFWTGYCIDFAQKLSELMEFDYEVVEPASGTFGEKIDGQWDGVVGDLARGDTDIAMTALIMTADKEEVIDFVAPYFDHTGISIVMRKPIRETSLFKFMTVLKLEVWLSIVGALVVTGFMVWILDKYSPYSARNNKKAYPYPCRDFTLKESFWFALTSFTPQGGGEAPKALSGRTLVAAYWLFVVLMLATFTANLAAFLTVERMQTAVQSLEQLARQSRIKYTVVESSVTHSYFINMKNAEDTLYRMWKELTLNASTEDTQYRVWDYPIREQYGHILIAINDSNPVVIAREGFDKVHNNMNGDFAFIHDAMEIKYEMAKSCNFTEVGELFGEMPYAVGVQQGSHLMDQISIKILDLQRDRFFEHLQEKYWNTTERGDCGSEDSEGISLESLGGVFIATLFGLALAMITLAAEVIYYRRQRRINDIKKPPQAPPLPNKKPLTLSEKIPEQYQFKLANTAMYDPSKPITLGGDTFKPITNQDKRRMSHYSLYPKPRNRLPRVE